MIHLPFEDRLEAGRALATELRSHGFPHDSLVLALARGGVPVGFEVADRLRLPLDVVGARRIAIPWQPEVTIGALAGKSHVLDESLIRELDLTATELQELIAREEMEASRCEEFHRSGLPALDLSGRSAVIVDDGLATGNTALAAIRHVRTRKPLRIILAVPVASRDGFNRVRGEVDSAICLTIPEHFYAIGEWYRDFPRVSDFAVKSLLARSHNDLLHRHSGSLAGTA